MNNCRLIALPVLIIFLVNGCADRTDMPVALINEHKVTWYDIIEITRDYQKMHPDHKDADKYPAFRQYVHDLVIVPEIKALEMKEKHAKNPVVNGQVRHLYETWLLDAYHQDLLSNYSSDSTELEKQGYIDSHVERIKKSIDLLVIEDNIESQNPNDPVIKHADDVVLTVEELEILMYKKRYGGRSKSAFLTYRLPWSVTNEDKKAFIDNYIPELLQVIDAGNKKIDKGNRFRWFYGNAERDFYNALFRLEIDTVDFTVSNQEIDRFYLANRDAKYVYAAETERQGKTVYLDVKGLRDQIRIELMSKKYDDYVENWVKNTMHKYEVTWYDENLRYYLER
jgi:hypothetical protein